MRQIHINLTDFQGQLILNHTLEPIIKIKIEDWEPDFLIDTGATFSEDLSLPITSNSIGMIGQLILLPISQATPVSLGPFSINQALLVSDASLAKSTFLVEICYINLMASSSLMRWTLLFPCSQTKP